MLLTGRIASIRTGATYVNVRPVAGTTSRARGPAISRSKQLPTSFSDVFVVSNTIQEYGAILLFVFIEATTV